MKQFVKFLLLTLSTMAVAQTTPNLHMTIPPIHSLNWGPPLVTNFTLIDTFAGTTATKLNPVFTGIVTFPLTGLTQCLHVNTSGVVSGTGADCGAGSGGVATVFGRAGAVIAVSGDYSAGQISGLAASATTDTTNASNVTSGTLAAARIANPLTQNTSGNAGTASALAAIPVPCSGGQAAAGILANGNSTGCFTPAGGGGSQILYLSTYAVGGGSNYSCKDTYPAGGCVDQTTQIQAAIDAAHTGVKTLFIDSAGSGKCWLASTLTFYDNSYIVGGAYGYGKGSAFCQIPGTNQPFMQSDLTYPADSYLDTTFLSHFAISQNYTVSTSGSAIKLNSRMGELSTLDTLSLGPGPADGIETVRGGDPARIANVGGYQYPNGSTINWTKTGGDASNRVTFSSIAGDNVGHCPIGIHLGSGIYTADSYFIQDLKAETRMDNRSVPLGTPCAVWADNLNGTPVSIGAINLVTVNASAGITNVVGSSCNGTTCNLVVTHTGGTLVSPSVSDLVAVTSNSVSGFNTQTCMVTASTATTITCTATTAASNGTGTGGTAFWNRKTQGAVRITSSSANIQIGNYTGEGGTNNQGAFGYTNVIDDEWGGYAVTIASIRGTDVTAGGSFVSGTYQAGDRTFAYNGNTHVANSTSDINDETFYISGEAYPRTRIASGRLWFGTGAVETDAELERTATAELGVAWPGHNYGGMALTHVYSSPTTSTLALGVDATHNWLFQADGGYVPTTASAPSGACSVAGEIMTARNGTLTTCIGSVWTPFGGSGTMTAVSVATANGISGTSSGGTTPALTLALGAITPTSISVADAVNNSQIDFQAGSGGDATCIVSTSGHATQCLKAGVIQCSVNGGAFTPCTGTPGFATVAASATTAVVSATSVTATSKILLTWDSSLGTALSVTCNTTPTLLSVSARSVGTSFTVTTTAPTTNPACFSYTVTN